MKLKEEFVLKSLEPGMGHYVRDDLVAKNSPLTAFRVSAESGAARDDVTITAISVRIDVGRILLDPPEQAALLAAVEKWSPRFLLHVAAILACKAARQVPPGRTS